MNAWMTAGWRALEQTGMASALVDVWLKSALVLVVASGLCLCWRRSAASVRHLLWFAALAGCLCLPVLSGLLPGWQRPLWRVTSWRGEDNQITLSLKLAPARETASVVAPAAASVVVAEPLTGLPAVAPPGAGFSTHLRSDRAGMFLVVWGGGTAFTLLGMAVGYWRLRSVRRAAAAPLDTAWFVLLRRLCAETRVDRPVTLLRSTENVMPITWGWRRPVILLPVRADGWSPDHRRRLRLAAFSPSAR